MNFKSIFIFLVAGLFLVNQVLFVTGCANIIPPSGGPRDSIPPTLLFATPPDSTTGFDAKRIVFEFDEYIEIQDVVRNVIFSPTPDVNPFVESKLKTVSVRLRDSLEPNTTYTIDFGNAIKDYNEGNVLKNFTYVFSTGSSIDSLTLEGNVILARDGKIDTTLIVMLHRNPDDSAVVKERPRYYTRLDSRGYFKFNFLPPGPFYLYALQDQGGQRRYTTPEQLFAFAAETVNPATADSLITLYAYSKETTAVAPGAGVRIAGTPQQENRIRFSTNVVNAPLDLYGSLQMNFEQPLQQFDSTAISFYTDSSYIPFPDFSTTLDTSNKQVTITANWLPGTAYHMVLQPSFATDSSGKQLLKTDTINFTTRKISDYGSVRIRFRNLQSYTNPVLQFVLNNQVVAAYPLTTDVFNRAHFMPGDYELRILNDTNDNGVWDAGSFFGVRRQPEIVRPISSRRVNIKPDWDNEFEIEAPSND